MSASPRFLERIIITGKLKAMAPLHIGGLDLAIHTDMPLICDVAGNPFVPGSSLAGILRAACESENAADALFGFSNKDNEGWASAVSVDDAALLGTAVIEQIDRVRIDRYTGAAAYRARFDLEAVTAGTQFNFRALLLVNNRSQNYQTEFMRVIALLANGHLGLGRGQGPVQLVEWAIVRQDFRSVAGILNALQGKTAASPEALPNGLGDEVIVRIPFKSQGPLMVKASHDGMDIDMLPRTSMHNGKPALVLPASSIKGAFRSHAERIMRTVLDPKTFTEVTPPKMGHANTGTVHLDVPFVDVLFGLGRTGGDGKRTGREKPRTGTSGALRFNTLYAAANEGWVELASAKLTEKDEPLTNHYDSLQSNGLRNQQQKAAPQVDVAYHVAIDRWTGGAAENMLYTAVEPWQVDWPAIEIRFHRGKLERYFKARGYASPSDAALAAEVLLWHVLNDFCAGEIPLGFGSTRGYGQVSAIRADVSLESCVAPNLAAVLDSPPSRHAEAWKHLEKAIKQEDEVKNANAN